MNNQELLLYTLFQSIRWANKQTRNRLRKACGVSEKRFEAFLTKAQFVAVVKSQVRTINVIESSNGQIQRIRSFPDNLNGNTAAEKFFANQIRKHNPSTTIPLAKIEGWLEDGIYESEGYQLLLTHSM